MSTWHCIRLVSVLIWEKTASSIIFLLQDFSVVSFQKVSVFHLDLLFLTFCSYFPAWLQKICTFQHLQPSGKIKATKKKKQEKWRRQNDKCMETALRSHSLAIVQQSITKTGVMGFIITSSNSRMLKQDSAGLSTFPSSSARLIVKRELKYLCNSIRSAANQMQ